MSPPSPSRRAVVRIGRGPRECESLLLADLEPFVADGLVAEPVLVVVPSRSLALHLSARLVERFGRPILGVRCITLWGLALAILEAAGEPPPPGVDLFPLFARRHARSEPLLVRDLGGLHDGYGALLGAVRDLLDAGLEVEHLPALEDALDPPPRGIAPRDAARALAVARVAGATARDLAALGHGHRSDVLRRAAVAARSGGGPRCRALVVLGFADATGVAGDLLLAVLEGAAGTLYLDEPPDPLTPGRADAGAAFSERFRQRLELVARTAGAAAGGTDRPELASFGALGSEAEVREVARRTRALLDGGARPERIGVVARHLAGYASPLRTQFARLGIPFSGLSATGPPGPDGRRARALLELLRQGGRTPIERWLELVRQGALGSRGSRLRAALFALGAGRLEEVAAAAEPLRAEAAEAPPRAGRRRLLSPTVLRPVAKAAGAISALVAGWPAGAPVEHDARLARLLDDLLGFRGARDEVRRAVEAVVAALPPQLDLDFDELVTLLAPILEALGLDPLGGAGGGVQVLDAIEARARTFEHLFVLGLNRGGFPRVVTEDPLLPEGVRLALGGRGTGVLPDLAEKRMGFDEERFLFAQLLAASPSVTLSWQETDDDNLPLAVSPLVARILGSPAAPEPSAPVRPAILDPGRGPLTAAEGAIVAGLARDRAALEVALELALAEGALGAEVERPERARDVAQARVRLLDELDPQRGTPAGERTHAALGPFFGFVGAVRGDDSRAGAGLSVTRLEDLAECPWRYFLERLLRLRPLPDPLETLPGVDPLRIGSLVHAVLQSMVEEAIGEPPATLDEARLRLGAPVPWPPAPRLSRLLRHHAEEIVRQAGLPLPGLARALAEAAAPILESARDVEWEGEALSEVLAAEVPGVVTLSDAAGSPRHVGFKADRVDRRAGRLRLTDYKTGRGAPLRGRDPAGRRRELLEATAGGRMLQAAAYVLAAGDAGSEGRYVYLHPDRGEDRPRCFSLEAGPEVAAAFGDAVRPILAAGDAGAFFPRFLLQDRSREHPHCERCDVRDACLRGDSGARRRLEDWLAVHLARPLAPVPASPAEAALLALWPLGSDQ